jgi:hypothetical protein
MSVCMSVCMYVCITCKYLLYVYKSQKIDFRLNYKCVCIGDVNFDLQGRSNYVSTLQFDETKYKRQPFSCLPTLPYP